MKPKISVVIPVYNSETTLEEAIQSIQGQIDGPSVEVICVDDGSSDGSLSLLRQLAQKDSRIHVLTQQNQFAGIARNRGMELAKGEYLAFLDADDYYFPHALKELYSSAERYHLDFVKGSFQYENMQTGESNASLYARNSTIEWPRRGRVIQFGQLPYRLLNVADVPWNGLYRRGFLERNQIRFNGLRCVNDHSFYIDCLIHAERIMVVNTKVACYRVGQETSLIGQKAKYFSCCLDSYYIVRDHCQRISTNLRQIILQQELTSIFGWYERLKMQRNAPDKMDEELKNFLLSFEEQDVGEQFLCAFPYADLYYQIRYNAKPPHGRPSMPVRALQCLREHGWQYTVSRIMKKGYR